MIKALVSGKFIEDNSPVDNVVILGLSEMNIERLQEGFPMALNLKELGLPDQQIVIVTGKDEKTIARDLGLTDQ